MLKFRPHWQLPLVTGAVIAVNIFANLGLFLLARSTHRMTEGWVLLLAAAISTLLILSVAAAVWVSARVLRRLAAGMHELQRGAYPLLVAPKSNPLGEHIRLFNQLSAELRSREQKTKAWAQDRESELARTARLLRLKHQKVEALREMPQALVLVDSQNNIFAVDHTAAELIGAPEESLSNTPLEQVVSRLKQRASSAVVFEEDCARLRDGKVDEIQLEMETPREARLRIARMRVAGLEAAPSQPRVAGKGKPSNTEVEKMKTEFLSTISHELRTPLTSIKGSLSLMQSGSSGHIPAEARDLLEIALGNTDRLIATITNVLDVAQLEYGGVNFEISAAPFAGIVEEAIQEVRPEAVTRNVRIEVSLPDPPPVLTVDSKRIVQVLRHLLSNAIKFSSPNGRIVLAGVVQGGSLVVSVQDFGVGISSEFMGKLFQKFEHQQDALTRDTQGCGLGLAICKLVVEAHGGRIWVESVEGRGSTFFISLPTQAPAGRTILLVDDDDDLQPTVAEYCERRGFRVLPCHNPKDVVRLARSYHPQIVALDNLEPSGTSAEICGRLAADPATQGIPVVCFVGNNETAYAHGPNLHLLTKPLDVAAFGGLLDRVFANSGADGA